jgi:hypothetical protein
VGNVFAHDVPLIRKCKGARGLIKNEQQRQKGGTENREEGKTERRRDWERKKNWKTKGERKTGGTGGKRKTRTDRRKGNQGNTEKRR